MRNRKVQRYFDVGCKLVILILNIIKRENIFKIKWRYSFILFLWNRIWFYFNIYLWMSFSLQLTCKKRSDNYCGINWISLEFIFSYLETFLAAQVKEKAIWKLLARKRESTNLTSLLKFVTSMTEDFHLKRYIVS